MATDSLDEIIPVLQVAIGPVILISGVGLLLLTMTNRLGRAIDRARQLAREVRERDGAQRAQMLAQVATIYRRARVIRFTITLTAVSVLLAAVLILVLFLTALFQWKAVMPVSLVFIACMATLVASLVGFIYDINLSLAALKLELKHAKPDLARGQP